MKQKRTPDSEKRTTIFFPVLRLHNREKNLHNYLENETIIHNLLLMQILINFRFFKANDTYLKSVFYKCCPAKH